MMDVRDILGRLLGEPAPDSNWAGTPRFRCSAGCSVELSTFAEIVAHRARCVRYFIFDGGAANAAEWTVADPWDDSFIVVGAALDDSGYQARHRGCVCQDGASQ